MSERASASGADVLIVGGGLVGCLSALRLRQAGAAVTVLERSVPGAEASSAAAGILAAQVEARAPGPLFELGLESLARHEALARELREGPGLGLDVGFARRGTLELAFDDEALEGFDRAMAFQRARGLRVERVAGVALRALAPGVSERCAGGVYFPDDAQLEPAALVRAVALAAERAGVAFRSGAYVRRILSQAGRVTGVELDDGALDASRVVLAAGAWSRLVEGAGEAVRAVRPARGQLVELLVRTPPAGPVLYGLGGYVLSRPDGRVVCGSTLEFVGYQKTVTPAGLSKVLALAQGLVPSLAEAEFHRAWANFRPHSSDGAPLVGDGGLAGLTVATGHHRSGVLLAPATAARVVSHALGAPLDALAAPAESAGALLDPRRAGLAPVSAGPTEHGAARGASTEAR